MENYDIALSRDVTTEEQESGDVMVQLRGYDQKVKVILQEDGNYIAKIGSAESLLIKKEAALKWSENYLREMQAAEAVASL